MKRQTVYNESISKCHYGWIWVRNYHDEIIQTKWSCRCTHLFLLSELPQSFLINVDVHQVSMHVASCWRESADFTIDWATDEHPVPILTIVGLQHKSPLTQTLSGRSPRSPSKPLQSQIGDRFPHSTNSPTFPVTATEARCLLTLTVRE